MNLPSVHIVILNWNGLEDTSECLSSIRKLTYPNVSVQVVDNASKNQEADVIEKRFPEVRLSRQEENLGFCGGCNAGMRRALEEGADYVMLLNNDALLLPDLIEKLLGAYEKLENAGSISPVILRYPETEKIWFSIAEWEADWKSGEAGFRLSRDEKYEDIKDRSPYETEFACGCCLFTSAEVINKVGVFDERYFAFYDEAEWCARMKKQGLTSYVVPSAVIYHKTGGSTPNLVMTYLMARNRPLWIAENLPLKRKAMTYLVMGKEFIWHLLNAKNLIPESRRYTPQIKSRVVLQGWKDYFLGRFGKWNEEAERLIFNNKN